MRKIHTPLLVALSLFFSSFPAFGQATINEGLETALIYVDAVNGSDSNPGTAALPLKTISAGASVAAQNNQNGIGTRVTIDPGTYRESIALHSNSKTTNSPVTFQAATNGTAIISGADVWTGWQPYGTNPQIYTNSWPYQWGVCPPMSSGPFEQNIVLRREMMFVNGTPLTQVLSFAQMVQGTFFVDESGGTVYIWPAAGTDVSTATIEVATRSGLFTAQGMSNLVLRGLTFQYDNSCKTNAAVSLTGSASNILVDSDNFLWNNAQGLDLSHPLTNVTVQNTVSNHNGESGFQDYEMMNLLWQSDQASYNNWRGAQGALYGWNTGGAHLYYDHAETVNGFTALFNTSHGVHWDTGGENVTVSSMVAANNLLNGAFVEASEGPVTLSNGQFCANTYSGVAVKDSPLVTLSGNTFYNNAASQIGIGGVPGGEMITDWQTGQTSDLITQNLTLTGNAVEGLGAEYALSDSYLGGTDWTSFVSTLASNNNTWWTPSNTTPFVVPVPNGGTAETFAQWQSTTGQDLNSTFAAPSGEPPAACQVSPDVPDYWLTVDSPTLTASAAGQATYNLSGVPLSWSGTVNLTLDGATEVNGLSATLGSATLNISGGNSATTTLTLGDTTSTPPGTYPITVIANSGSLTHTVTVSLVVPVTSVRLSIGSLGFGNQQINTTSPAQTVTLSNIGSTTLTITSMATGNNFAETNNCGTSLKAGASCTISVTFTPGSVASITGTLTIADSDAASPQTVSLSGTGTAAPTATLSTHSLSFGGQVVGITSASQTVTLTNTGTVTLNISNVAITGTNPSYYNQSNNCGSSLAAGASCTFTVTFTPSTTSSTSAVLTITDNVSSGSQTINLSGHGTTAVSLSKSSINFSSRQVGTTSSAQTITLTNLGNTLTIQSILITGTNPGDFAQTNTCGTSVAAGANCTINVTFTPAASGTRSASVTISDSDPASPQNVTLTGTGTTSPDAILSTHSLSFGAQVVGTTSAAQTVTLTNTGTGTLSISNISITGTNPSYFTQSNNCGSSLAVEALCTLTVTFTPATTGSMSATLTITDNSGAGSQTVNLSGNGKTAVSLSRSSITFVSRKVGTTSSTQTITLTNLGNKLTLNSITITGTNPGDFAQTNTCGTSVAGGASCTINVTFTPTATGTRSASVTLSDSDPTSPQNVSLSGTGT
ncbi:MAG TPA: choice-of-anchor D domain-containing protein [Terriglobia bacterium]|nr:choice-of-anchor D domain-containing protein [Terriglobia bacterium]